MVTDAEQRSGGNETDIALAHSELDLRPWMQALSALPSRLITESDIRVWLEGPLRMFLPFERVLCAYGDLSGGRIRIRSLLSSGYGSDFLSGIESTFDLKSRGCFSWWVANRKPFILDETGGFSEGIGSVSATQPELDEMRRFSLGVIAAHGVVDPFANAGTYISFSGVPKTEPKRTLAALDLIAPVVHTLFLATTPVKTSGIDLTALTDRQRELVDLAVEGLSDKEIASRLSISDHTVGNHFRTIYLRLGISKRTQLIAALK